MDQNDGRFQDNGGCGYILKPALLLSAQGNFDPCSRQRGRQATHLLLKVVHARHPSIQDGFTLDLNVQMCLQWHTNWAIVMRMELILLPGPPDR